MESIDVRGTVIQLESLSDIDKTIDELFEMYQTNGETELFEEMCPYFGTLWPAGRVLTEYVSEHLHEILPAGLLQPRILEIGCGLALPSLYLSKCGLKVSATDIHPDVPVFLDVNRRHNLADGPRFIHLDWRESAAESWDLILASDVLYDKTQPHTLLRFLSSALAPNGKAVIADPGRSYLPVFFDSAVQTGFRLKRAGMFGVLIGELTRDVVS